jgi:hypothetical protein
MESTTTEQRILIHQDDALLNDILRDLNVYITPLNNLKDAYEALQLGDFSDKVLKQLTTKGIDEIVTTYRKSLNDNLDSTGVVNTILRTIALQGSEEPVSNLHRALKEALNAKPEPKGGISSSARTQLLLLPDISFKNGQFGVFDQESILERHCRIYVEDKKSREIYFNLLKVQESLQDYVKWVNDLGLPRGIFGGSFTDNLKEFFSYNPETFEIAIRPTSIKWAVNLKGERERMQARFNR